MMAELGILTRSADEAQIPEAVHQFLVLDLVPLLAVTLAAAALALVGSFLVLERRAMLGDAVAHSVLPGLVLGFAVTGSREPLPMFIGALIAALITSAAVGGVSSVARIDPQTSIGIAFTTMFALGVLLVETTGARNVDLDLDCVLSGQLELLFWSAPQTWSELLGAESLASLPQPLLVLSGLVAGLIMLTVVFWPTIRCATFDPRYATSRGLRARAVRGGVLFATTGVIVASFESLGSILVIALLTCPAAASRLVTRRLARYVATATMLGAASGVIGYLSATRLAVHVVGHAVDASGAVATTAGLCVAAAALRYARNARAT